MILLKALFEALKDVLVIWSNVFSLLVDLFWCLMGIIGLFLSVALFPVILYRKYAQIRTGATKRKNIGKRTT